MAHTTPGLESAPIHFKRILFATDFSRASATALPYVAAIAHRFGSEIYVAHAISPEEYRHALAQEREAALTRMQQEAEAGITSMLGSSHFQGIPHRVLLERGQVWPVLSALAEKNEIDLIAAGTHGPHGLEKLVSGSTAEEISRLATSPVLLVGPAVKTPPEAEVHVERILYSTDFSPEAKPALEFAYVLARAYAAHLFVLHVVDNPLGEPLATRMSADAYCRLKLLEKRWPQRVQAVEPEFLVEFGAPEVQTLEVVQKRGVQLLVLSSPKAKHAELVAHLPGALAYNLVTHAPCPVLAVRDPQVSE